MTAGSKVELPEDLFPRNQFLPAHISLIHKALKNTRGRSALMQSLIRPTQDKIEYAEANLDLLKRLGLEASSSSKQLESLKLWLGRIEFFRKLLDGSELFDQESIDEITSRLEGIIHKIEPPPPCERVSRWTWFMES